MRKSILVLLLSGSSFCFSQDVAKPEKQKLSGQHTIYAEAFGNVLLFYSIGYDYTLKLKEKHKISFNCGFQYITNNIKNYTLSLSPQISYLYGKNHHLELGVGGTGFFEYYDKVYGTSWVIPFRVGYRYQRENGGFFFKIAYTPSFNTILNVGDSDPGDPFYWVPTPLWGGVAFGYTFKHKPQK